MRPVDARPLLRYRWIVTDLDGTLVDRQLAMVESSRQALLAYRALGGEVVIATGRSASSAQRYYDQLGLTGPAILLNGALVMNLSTGEVLRDIRFGATTWAALRGILDGIPSGQTATVVFAGGRAFTNASSALLDAYAARDQIVVERVASWDSAVRPGEVSKVMILTTEPSVAASVAATVRDSGPPVTVIMSESTYVEVLPAGSDKGTALRWLAARAAIPLEDVAAVGDNPNDVPMLLVAGLGAAVGDGHADVRAVAGVVVGVCTSGAVADVVSHAMLP